MLKNENLKFPKYLKHLKNFKNFNNFLKSLYRRNWVTYIEPPKGKLENVIEYVWRYSFRVAFSNSRIKNVDCGLITFEYKDYKDNSKILKKTFTNQITRKLYEFKCKICGSTNFTYSFEYDFYRFANSIA